MGPVLGGVDRGLGPHHRHDALGGGHGHPRHQPIVALPIDDAIGVGGAGGIAVGGGTDADEPVAARGVHAQGDAARRGREHGQVGDGVHVVGQLARRQRGLALELGAGVGHVEPVDHQRQRHAEQGHGQRGHGHDGDGDAPSHGASYR